MYINENLKEQIVLIDPYIHKRTKFTKVEFLEKVEYIKQLRTTYNSKYISFYITSLEEYNNLIKFHDLVNKGIFDFTTHNVFAVAIQPKLYQWFKSTEINTIQKQITSWMAGLYYFNPERRYIIKQQVYKPLFEEILNIVDTYYKDVTINNLPKPYKILISDEDELFDEEDKRKIKYLEVFKDYCKTEPPEFLNSPYDYQNLKEWGVDEHFNFQFIQAYLNENDWKRIIIKFNMNNQDNMSRAESSDELWLKWKHVFTTFEKRKNFVYSLFLEKNQVNGNNKSIKRETIPQEVKDKVWQRDNAMCVICCSKEKLEFDHIIPFSKGGSSSYRNLQILCELCNRKKRDKI